MRSRTCTGSSVIDQTFPNLDLHHWGKLEWVFCNELSRDVVIPLGYKVSSVRDDFPIPTQRQHDRAPALGRSSFLFGISHTHRITRTNTARTWEHFQFSHGHLKPTNKDEIIKFLINIVVLLLRWTINLIYIYFI